MEIINDRSEPLEETLRAMNELTGWESCKTAKRPPDKEIKRDKK